MNCHETCDEIIEILSDKDGCLSEALLKTKVLLHFLGQKELIAWVNSELNGYSDDQDLPNYRKIPAQVLANLNSIAFRATSHPLPIGHLTKEVKEDLEIAKMGQSLAVLERYSQDSKGSLEQPIPLEYNPLLGKSLARGVSIQRAWSQIEITSIVQILSEVRSRLLDFVLNLREELPEQPNKIETKSIDTKSLFNNAILGDNATIIIGDKNKAEIINQHLKGNLNALEHELRKYDVSKEDIFNLQSAIQSDEKNIDPTKKEFGGSVKHWIKDMLHKAVDTSWQIEVGMASSILTNALNHYYGWF